MSKYKTMTSDIGQDFIVRDNVAFIPIVEANTDYQAYLAWLAEGNTPEEWSPNGDQ